MTRGEQLHRADQRRSLNVLLQYADNSGPHRGEYTLVLGRGHQQRHGHVSERWLRHDRRGRLEVIETRQPLVQQRDIGTGARRQREGLPSACRLAHNRDALAALEQRAVTRTSQALTVGE